MIGIGVAGAFLVPTVVTAVPAVAFSVLGLVLAILLWVVFGKGVAKCEVR